MKRLLPLIGLLTATTFAAPAKSAPECVVLLHGVLQSGLSMELIESALARDGYRVLNVSYPSRRLNVEQIARDFLPKQLAKAGITDAPRMHFVCHSMGSLVARTFLRDSPPANLGRVVMLGPPNHGSAAADKLANNEFFRWAVGVNLDNLRTTPDALAQKLPPADYELGIIAGETSINPLFRKSVGGKADGPVSLESARLEGMTDFLVVKHSHTLMLWQSDVIAQVVAFVRNGKFDRPAPKRK